MTKKASNIFCSTNGIIHRFIVLSIDFYCAIFISTKCWHVYSVLFSSCIDGIFSFCPVFPAICFIEAKMFWMRHNFFFSNKYGSKFYKTEIFVWKKKKEGRACVLYMCAWLEYYILYWLPVANFALITYVNQCCQSIQVLSQCHKTRVTMYGRFFFFQMYPVFD